MKHLFFTVVVLSIMSVAVSTNALADCARLAADHLKYLTDSIEKDLINMVWTTDMLGAETEVFFHADGTVESIQEAGAPRIQFMQWAVRRVDGVPVLTITAADGSSRTLLLRPTCEGFAVNDAFGVETQILMQGEQKSDRLQLTRSQMAGVWKSMGKRSTGMRDLQWNLKSDGTFTLAVSPDMYHATHQGVWDIASDGQHLLLYFARNENPETVYTTEIVRIRSVDFEDLVLEVQDLSVLFGHGRNGQAERDFVKDFSM